VGGGKEGYRVIQGTLNAGRPGGDSAKTRLAMGGKMLKSQGKSL